MVATKRTASRSKADAEERARFIKGDGRCDTGERDKRLGMMEVTRRCAQVPPDGAAESTGRGSSSDKHGPLGGH